jgi:hypothetical protein
VKRWVFETDEYRNCLIVGVKGLDLHVLTSAWVEIGTAKNMSSAQALIDLRIEAFLTADWMQCWCRPASEGTMTDQSTTATGLGVYRAINAVQADIAREGIGKNHKNAAQGYSFRGIDDIYNALAPLLAAHRLCIMPLVLSRECGSWKTKGDATMFSVTLQVAFDFVSAEDGSTHRAVVFGEGMDTGDKATNKAFSAAYKYAALQVFCIPTEGEDADSTSPAVATKPVTRKPDAPATPAPGKPAPAINADSRALVSALVDKQAALSEIASKAKSLTDTQRADFTKAVLEFSQAVNVQLKIRGMAVIAAAAKTGETFGSASRALTTLVDYDLHAPIEPGANGHKKTA